MAFLSKKLNKNRGVATLEILIAMTIIVLSISAVTMLLFGSQSISTGSQTYQEALYKSQKAIEDARSTALSNFNDPSLNPGTTVTNDTSGITYTKNLIVTKIDDFTKNITSRVTWGGAGSYVQLSTIVTDWQGALGICSPTLSGDWTAPQVYGYVDFPSSNGASGVDVKGPKAYVSSDPKSATTDDFYVIDAGDPTQKPLPILGHFSTSYGLTDVTTVGSYAYVTADSALFQLLVIDVSNPAALAPSKIVAKRDVTSVGDTAYGNTLFYANKKIYLGLTLSSSPEFHIFDVSNPLNPLELGSGYEVGATINSIVVKNNIAYLTTTGNDQVIALDVTNPSNPILIAKYTSAAPPFSQSLVLDSGTTLYLGRTGGNVNPKLLALDSTHLSGTPKWTFNMNKQSGVYTEILRSNLLFMTTADPNDGLQIWDISNPSGPPVRFDTSPLNIQQNATAGTDCAGNLLYVAQKSNRALQIVGPYVPSPFDYMFSTLPTDVTIVRGGATQNTSFTITRTSGTAQPVAFTNSALSSGVTMAPSTVTICTPTCSDILTFSASPTATVGTTLVTITGNFPSHTTSFNLTVNAPPFTYSLSNALSDIALTHGGASVNQTVTVTMAAGAVPQAVTLTAPNPAANPADIVITPNPIQSCTPSATSPYTCSITFTYKAVASATKKTYNNQVINGAPNAQQTNKFKIIIN